MPATNEKTGKQPQTSSGKSIAPKGYIINMVLGDILVFLIFATIGRGSHGEQSGLAAIPQITWTALPFIVGWFAVAPWLGVYRYELATRPRLMTKYTLRGWGVAWPVAMLLRWLLVDRVTNQATLTSFLTFALVVFLTVTVLLIVWRWPYAWYQSMKEREEEARLKNERERKAQTSKSR